MYENVLARIVEYKTEPLLQRIVISFAMVKAEDLSVRIIELRPCVIAAMRNWTKEDRYLKTKGLRCSRVRTVPPLVGFLRADIL